MNVKKIRLSKGYTVPKLAALSRLSVRTIENVEKRNECTMTTAKKIVFTLRVSLDELCDFDYQDKPEAGD